MPVVRSWRLRRRKPSGSSSHGMVNVSLSDFTFQYSWRQAMSNEATVGNQKQILANQKEVLANQKKILGNQKRIEANQSKLVKVLENQKKILAKLS